MVPLEVADVVLVEQRQDLPLHVLVGAGDRQVEHLLVACRNGQLVACRHDPLGVGARHVRVGVDHLRLDPEPELHPQLADPVDERVQPVGPRVRRDDPVTEPRVVVAAGAEPAVVEHVALDPHARGPLGELEQRLEGVVEVHGLPHVQRHRPIGRDRAGPGPQVRVVAARDGIQPGAAREEHPRARVRLVAREPHLAGQQQLAPSEEPLTAEDLLGVVHVVAAPPRVHRAHQPALEAETGCARVQDVRAVGSGASLAVLTQVDAGAQRLPLRGPFATPPATEVEQLVEPGRQRQREHERRRR